MSVQHGSGNLSAAQDSVSIGYVRDPAWTGVYSLGDRLSGASATPTTFLSIFNPVASGKNMVLLAFMVESYSVAISAAKNALRLSRITAASDGALQTAAKFVSSDPAPVVEVRSTNPTITVLTDISTFAPNQNVTVDSSTAVSRREFRLEPSWGEFLLVPGEGVALRQGMAGDVDQEILVTVVWAER